ncbi:hypothetical protein HHI36_007134 [Cryptolaemus montrouzieri]|uniref:Uncharacterized protein n=1 Tax=Cryptolaemus montrouzieri TaxID=559131 RepID=A0ABD2MPH9_9CUCU
MPHIDMSIHVIFCYEIYAYASSCTRQNETVVCGVRIVVVPMSRSYEEEMKHLQKLYDELMSDEDIDVADPYADCNTSDEYEPSESESSNDD